jgi:type IV pilus assembly protein PilY1
MLIHIQPQHFHLRPVCAAIVTYFFSASYSLAAPITLSQSPPGNGGKEPAPNVILTVDDSGSMGWDVNDNGATAASPSKMTFLKAALINQFGTTNATTATKGNVPDGSIRLAWQSMWGNGNGGTSGAGSLTPGAINSMKPFTGSTTGTHRANFSTFVNNLTSNSTTPSHKMLSQAYNYMKSPQGINSPWAYHPGTTELPYLACRKTFHIFMTDGAWNQQGNLSAGGNADGTARTLGDGTTSYDPNSTQTRVYKDSWGGGAGQASTLSDFAFRSWAEDLQPNIPNSVKPIIKRSGSETVGSTVLQEFWNPKNDPATWQHIVQYTIGFGNGATTWSGAPDWDDTTDNNYGGGYSDLVNGIVSWPDPQVTNTNTNVPIRTSELWHSALNGRGKFYPARTAAALTAAFADILDNISKDTSKPLVSIAANSTTLKTGAYAYIAGYDGKDWSGKLSAYPINAVTGAPSTTAAWSAAAKLDDTTFSIANRFVASHNGSSGIEWKTLADLPALQQAPLNNNSSGTVDNNGQNRVDYIRGDRTKESSKTGGIFRDRSSRLGDIVNSNIAYLGVPASGYGDAAYLTFKGTTASGVGNRAPMIYVGANDGMLHGFDATTGVERLAYIPQGIAQGDLRKLTDTNYTHQYFVDGSPFTGDAKVGSSAGGATWKTILVSGLGAGGKGYFVLDASNPNNFNATNAANLVITDTTATTDPDIGNMFIVPAMDDFIAGKSDQIVRLNAPQSGTAPNQIKHRWALVLGNGYNSSNEAPVLIVQYLDGAKEIKKISPCDEPIATTSCNFKTANGLSTPRLVDLNGDGVADVAYAGDLSGNVWKFDLSSQNDVEWKTSFNKQPLFKAKPGQSFTTAPYVVSNDAAGYGAMIHISSGKNLTTADQTSTGTETTYSLWDNSTFKNEPVSPATTPATYKFKITDSTPINTTSSATLPNSMVKQTISSSTFVDSGITYFTSTSNPVSYKGTSAKRGWFMDWTIPGQRVLRNSKSFDGQKVSIYSTVPSSATGATSGETCTPNMTPERSFLTVVNLFSGNPSQSPVFDLTASAASSHPATTGMENNPAGDSIELRTTKGVKIVTPCPEGTVCAPPTELKFGSYVGARANWRQKQ